MKLELSKIPNNPGCYLFLDKDKNIIYIGKAKNLHKRVSSYFNKKDHDEKTKVMLSQVDTIDFIVTNSEVEALVLENNLIKKNFPKYNINLKDSKRYAYLEIVNEKFPRLLVARKTKSDGKLFGPFTSGANRDYVKEILTKTFKIRTCNKLPKKPCLRYHLGLCYAPCAGKQSEEDYNKNIRAVEAVLKGNTRHIIKNLGRAMQNSANVQDYELALKYRDQINSLKILEEKQNMERQKKYDEDIINYVINKGQIHLMLFNINKGTLENKQEFEFEENEEFLEEFLIQYYSENSVPGELILPDKISGAIGEFLRSKRGKKLVVNVPQKGEKKELLDLVKKNIEIQLFGDTDKLEELKNRLDLQDTPLVIECFDISHLGGTATVGSMVQFRNAKPDKSNYRRFKIKTVEGIDDFAAMGEVIRRRYFRLLQNKESFPNLVLIDGGAGQLHSAIEELEKLGIKVPIIALAKKEEEIYVPGKKMPIKLDKKNKGLLLLTSIRDEAHRFAIKYNRLLRSKKLRE